VNKIFNFSNINKNTTELKPNFLKKCFINSKEKKPKKNLLCSLLIFNLKMINFQCSMVLNTKKINSGKGLAYPVALI